MRETAQQLNQLEQLKNIPIPGKTWKPNKRIVVVTLIAAILLSGAVFTASLFSSFAGEAYLLNSYLDSLPRILDERADDLKNAYTTFQDDCKARGNTGKTLYDESEGDQAARLEMIKGAISAQDVSIVDGQGNILASTRSGSSFELSQDEIAWALGTDGDVVDLARWQVDEPSEADTSESDGDSGPVELMLYKARFDDGRYLFIEFGFGSFGKTYEELGLWTNMLERMIAGLDAYAFAVADGEDPILYPYEGFSETELDSASSTIKGVVNNERDTFTDDGLGFTINRLFGEPVLLAGKRLSDENVTVIIAVPFKSFVKGTLYSCIASILFMICSLILLAVYTRKTIAKRELAETDPNARRKEARRRCLPGFIVAVIAVVCFTLMLQGLESMSSSASTTKNQREILQAEMMYHDTLKTRALEGYEERCITRASALALLLNENPQLRTRADLQRLAGISGVDYLMLFDENGNEVTSSNSYQGFSVSSKEEDPSHAYQVVLMGKPYVSTESIKDDITGKYQHTVAALLTNAEGLPNGFLVVAFDDSAIRKETADHTQESVVKGFATQTDQVAMTVAKDTGLIKAHTNPDMIGFEAKSIVDEAILGHKFEGFTTYEGQYSYVSEVFADNTSIMVITKNDFNFTLTILPIVVLLAFTLIVFTLYFRSVVKSCARAEHSEEDEEAGSHLNIFAYGYIAFLVVLASFATYQAAKGNWPAFGFVFSGEWSKNVNLFSLWMAVFIFSGVLFVVFLLRIILGYASKRVSPRYQTFTHLANSIVTYGAVIVLLVYILKMFGVDTTAILASAGIGAIAIGMGAKDLIGDILAGLFIIFEGSIHVGDIVEIGGWRGRVTDMGIRTCEITNESNDVKIVTNSRISEIVNLSRKKTACTADFEIPRTVDADKVGEFMDGYIKSVVKEIPELKSSLHFAGLTSFTEDKYTVRLKYQCNEADRKSLEIKLNTALQLLFEGDGLSITALGDSAAAATSKSGAKKR